MTTQPAEWNFDAYLGSDFNPEFIYLNEDDQPVSLTGYNATMEFRSRPDLTGSPIFSISKAAGQIELGADGRNAPTLTRQQLQLLAQKSATIYYRYTLFPPAASSFPLIEGRILLK